MTSPTPENRSAERPALFKLGVALLAVHELIVIGLCAMGGVIGAFAILFGSLRGSGSGETTVTILLGSLAALLLMLCVAFAVTSLAVCAMAWRGSRIWLQLLIGVALVNCIVIAPNPLGIIAAILCVLGSLQYLEVLPTDTTEDAVPGESKESFDQPEPESEV